MQDQDRAAMDRLLFHAFGPDRCLLPSYALRAGAPLDRLSWVARAAQGQVLGCLRFWQVALSLSDLRCVLLGPLAVDRAYRGAGIAHSLVRFALSRAADLGFELCFVVGEPRLYRQFGFTNAAWSHITADAPIPARRLQVVELREGVLAHLHVPQNLRAMRDGCGV